MPLTEVTFRLSPSCGIHTAREARDSFLRMMQEHEEFENCGRWLGAKIAGATAASDSRLLLTTGDRPLTTVHPFHDLRLGPATADRSKAVEIKTYWEIRG